MSDISTKLAGLGGQDRFHNGSSMEPPRNQTMASLTIKGMSDQLLEQLRQAAAAHRRSLNQEALHGLELHVRRAPLAIDQFLDRVRKRREAMNGPAATRDEIDA